MEPPFLSASCKGPRPDGTYVNRELVKDGCGQSLNLSDLVLLGAPN